MIPQQTVPKTPTTPGPLTAPRAFRRQVGMQVILISVLFSEVFGFLLFVLASLLLIPLLWWGIQSLLPLLHASLLLDVGIVLFLAIIAFGLLQYFVQKKSTDEAWGCTGVVLILLVTVFLLLALLKTSWFTFPAPIPAISPQPFHIWSLQASFPASVLVAGLIMLAHGVLWRQERRRSEAQLLPFSRAHQESMRWTLMEKGYDLYRQGLARFAPPPLRHLKTPPTFYFYPRNPQMEAEANAHPEREVSWLQGELVICQQWLSPDKEQVEVWLPLVARLLYDYNCPVAVVERIFRLAHRADTSLWGVLLLLPTTVTLSYERRWRMMERDLVLDRDRFAWHCGEGKRLQKLLRRQLGDLEKKGQPDTTVPTLTERLDHLDSLLRTEARQVKALRAALPPATQQESGS